jgi:hypothetical protein
VGIHGDEDFAKKAAEVKDPEQYTEGGYAGHGRKNTPRLNPAATRKGNEKRDLSPKEWKEGMGRFKNIKELRFYGCDTHDNKFAPKLKELMPKVDIESVDGPADLHYTTPGGGRLEVDLPSKLKPEDDPVPKGTPAELDTQITGGKRDIF